MSTSSSTDNGSARGDAALYKAATAGNFEFFANHPQPLDHLLIGKKKNTVLHFHLNTPYERSRDFVEKVLGQCPHLLWHINNDGDIPLHFAAKYGHLEMLKLLVEEAKKPIHRDLEIGEEEVSRRMLRSKNKQHGTALHLAARARRLNVVKEILEHEDPKYTYTANNWGESPIYISVKKESNNIATEIVEKFESPDCSGPNGSTAFHAAVSNKYSFTPDESGWTPLHLAAYLGKAMAVKMILETDESSAYAIDKERNRTPLHMASCRGIVSTMKKIIEKWPECCEITDVKGWNMLHYAVISENKEAVKAVMKDLSLVYLTKEQDIKGYTPLHILMASPHISSLLSWLENDEFLLDELWPIRLQKIQLDEDRYKREQNEILKWMNDLGEDPFGEKMVVRKSWEEIEKEIEESVIPGLEKAKDSHLVAAALVATVTFAAAFTLPGGYISDENDSKLKGTPILTRNIAFKAFVITDTIAMVLSTASVLRHFIMVMLGYKLRYYWLISLAFWFIVTAMGAMVVAFVTGTYAVLAPNSMGLAIATCIVELIFFVLVFYASVRLISNFVKHDREENQGRTLIESLLQLLYDAPQYLCE